jgi:hypothetical protein
VERSECPRNKTIFCSYNTRVSLRKAYIRDYWRTEPIILTNYAKSIGMSRDRFVAILTMLHLNNSETRVPRDQSGYDPLYKVQPIMSIVWLQNFKMCMLHRNFLQLMRPSVHFRDAYIFEYIWKENSVSMGWKFFNYVKPKQGMSAIWKCMLVPIPLIKNTIAYSVL